MGQTMTTWIGDVSDIIRDATHATVTSTTVQNRGVIPALRQYAVDRPRLLTVEQAGSGTAYQALPSSGAGWVTGFSRVSTVEYPARLNPPSIVTPGDWTVGRDPADVTIERLLLNDPAAADQYVRITFSSLWPIPTTDATVDQVDAVAYHAVTNLAASLVLRHLATGAARTRQGLLATTAREGDASAERIREAADDLRSVYAAFLGIQPAGGATPDVTGPAYAVVDYNPQRGSVFHGGRR